MITGAIVGTILCGLFPLLFVSLFRRAENERIINAPSPVAGDLAELDNEIRVVQTHLEMIRAKATEADATATSL